MEKSIAALACSTLAGAQKQMTLRKPHMYKHVGCGPECAKKHRLTTPLE